MKYRVRHYDGFDYVWMDVGEPGTLEDAQELWLQKTKNGTHQTTFNDIDYYAIWDENGSRLDLMWDLMPQEP